jgi:hypothetical protein
MSDERTPDERKQADKLLADYKRHLAEAEQAKEPNPLQATAVPLPPRQ